MLRNESCENCGARDIRVPQASLLDLFSSSISVLALVLPWSLRFRFDRKAVLWDAAAAAIIFSICHLSLFYHSMTHALPNISFPGFCVASIAFSIMITILHTTSLTEWLGTSQPATYEPLQSGLRPLMIPCRTTHTRLFPAKHSFSYSYLLVGIPVGWKGRAGTILSADRSSRPKQEESRTTWFSVEAEDYLERKSHPDGLDGKLFEYLKSQGVNPERYSHALLVTAPRFLGFSFNPVSFWYLYNDAKILEAMVVEVNNTFDERRMYFMERATDVVPALTTGKRHFKHCWEKDFHVSPFNSQDGSYAIQATDPLADADTGNVTVDCSIILRSTDQTPKLVARVFSSKPALDAVSMTRWQTLGFVFNWWWVGLMTNPRILREARILWVKKLQLYYRPEVLQTSIGRQETREEAKLEPCFRLLLEWLVQRSHKEILLKYTPIAGPQRGRLETFSNSDHTRCSQLEIEIRVLTPAFYSQFARFGDCRKAFHKLCFDAPDSERFLLISDRATFQELLSGIGQLDLRTSEARFSWRIVGWLRGKETTYGPLSPTTAERINCDDRRLSVLSQLDVLVLKDGDNVSKRHYCRTIAAILVSDQLAFGWIPLLRFYGLVMWMLLMYVAMRSGQNLVSSKPTGGSGRDFLSMLGMLTPHLWAYGSRFI